MGKIAEKTESTIDYTTYCERMGSFKMLEVNISNAISDATCRAAAVTLRGSSARMISRFRPGTPIIAVTPNEKTYMKLALSWGITPIMNEFLESANDLFDDALNRIMEHKFVKDGDIVVITGSTLHSAGSTNSLQVHIVGNILLKGKGNGAESVSGRVCVIKDEEKDFSNFKPGDILAVTRTTTDILHLMRQCSGVITEENERDSGIVAAGYALDIPVISGARSATSMLKTGAKVKIDAKNGYVYNSDTVDG
jgi:pyruvate kinase